MSTAALSGGMLRSSSGALVVQGLAGEDDLGLGVIAAPMVPGGAIAASANAMIANITSAVRLVPARDMLVKSMGFGLAVAAGGDDAIGLHIWDYVADTRIVNLTGLTGKVNGSPNAIWTTIPDTQLKAGRPYWLGLSSPVSFIGAAASIAGYNLGSFAWNHLLTPQGADTGAGVARNFAGAAPASVKASSSSLTVGPILAVREW